MSPTNFEEHLSVLRKYYEIISLQELISDLKIGRVRRNAVVISFDDGYEDNYLNAVPILTRYSAPATIFVTTQFFGQKSELWWDTLERIFLRPGELPAALEIRVSGGVCRLACSVSYSHEDYDLYRNWTVAHDFNPTERHAVYRRLCDIMRPLDFSERESVLSQLYAWAGRGEFVDFSNSLMGPGQVQSLARGGLVEIGGHTVTHPVLSALSHLRQKAEIEGSKQCLEEITGCKVDSFSYPYGGLSDYNAQTIAAVREAGFTSSCSNFPSHVRPRTDMYQLPRYLVRDWNAPIFFQTLKRWKGG